MTMDDRLAGFTLHDVAIGALCALEYFWAAWKTFLGEKCPAFSFGDASEIIQLWALYSRSPTPEIWLVPFPCERGQGATIKASLHTQGRPEISHFLLFPSAFRGMQLRARSRDKYWKVCVWWRYSTDRFPFPPSGEKMFSKTQRKACMGLN